MNLHKHLFSLSWLVLLGLLVTSCKDTSTTENKENSAGASSGNNSERVLNKEAFATGIKKSDAQIIDLRMTADYEQGHIEDAINLNFFDPEFKHKLLELNRNKTYYLYDKKEKTAYRSMKFMEDNDFKNVYMLQGGYEAWKGTNVE
jgi:rhodanese-related sulfurtransferase